MADWLKPTITSAYVNFVSEINSKELDLAKGLDPAKTTVTNPSVDMIRWNSAAKNWNIYNGTAWVALTDVFAISISGNAATATNVAWSGITSKPTTYSGYGITDVCPITTGSSVLKGNGVGGTTAAVAGADYQLPIGTISGIVKGGGANTIVAATAADLVAAIGTTAVTNATNATNATNSINASAAPWSGITGKPFNWLGQTGQPSWVWGSNDGTNYYIWNPSNFSVNYAVSAGNADTVDGQHASAFAAAGHSHGGTYVSTDNGHNAVGSFCFARCYNTSIGPGATIAGGSLAPAGIYEDAGGLHFISSGTLSGTWRCLGSVTGAGSGIYCVSLWQRIS